MRLIDADALVAKYGNWYTEEGFIGIIKSLVDTMPTIEPKLERGVWLPDNNNYITPYFVCSACGMLQKVETVMYKPLWAFCPRRGARMMKGEQE